MSKLVTIKDRCRGRLMDLPPHKEATREKRIEIVSHNIQVMREELGYIPPLYPQSDVDVSDWIYQSDRTINRIVELTAAISKLPVQSEFPAP